MSESASNKVVPDAALENQRDTFVASLGHDLKNPTIAQIRILELFLKGKFGLVNNNQRQIIEMLLDSCKYMNAMLGSLLITYRNEKGKIKLSNSEISIFNLAEECYDEIKYLAEDKGIIVNFENSTSNDIIWGDEIQLRRVIMNLLTNGIKYAYKNSPLFIRIYNNSKFVYFEFENKSPYLKPEKKEKIFARYISFNQANTSFGIGLGLYTSKKIIDAHEGEIYVKSFKDNRNIFGFKIPYGSANLKKQRFVVF